jgi:uncharacterized protein
MTEVATATVERRSVGPSVIDGDIHNQPKSRRDLGRYMTARWRRHHETFGPREYMGASYPRANDHAARTDSWPPGGAPPGSDLDFMRHQLLDTWGIEYGVLNPLLGAGQQRNLDYGAALARAINDWLIAEWLEPEPRLRASMVVEYEDASLAAAEIHRLGDHPGFVQVLLPIRTHEPLGRRKYWPMYEAAVSHRLPIGLHFGGSGGGPITGAGFPSFYIEDHAGMPTAFQSQVTSLVLEGVFERFPSLEIVLIEGGFAWLPPLMWRLDGCYRRLGEEVPHLTRLPSEYIRQHFWLTTQPMEEPSRPAYFHQLLAHLDMNDRLMFATDYPHWDFDAPDQAIPVKLDPELESAIMAGNARRLYGLRSAG